MLNPNYSTVSLGLFQGMDSPVFKRIFFELDHCSLFYFMMSCVWINRELKKNYLWKNKLKQRFPFAQIVSRRPLTSDRYFQEYRKWSEVAFSGMAKESRILLACVLDDDLEQIKEYVARIQERHALSVSHIFSCVNNNAVTPLLWAMLNQRQSVRDYLISHQCALTTVAHSDSLDYIQYFIRRHQLLFVRALWPLITDMTAKKKCLSTAIRANSLEITDFIIRQDVDPKLPLDNNDMATHLAASVSFTMYHYIQGLTALDPHTADSRGNRVMHYAGWAGRVDVLIYLEQEFGPQIYQVRNQAGETTLDCVLAAHRAANPDNPVEFSRYESCIQRIRASSQASSAPSLWRGARTLYQQNYLSKGDFLIKYNCLCFCIILLSLGASLVLMLDHRIKSGDVTLRYLGFTLGSLLVCCGLTNCLMLCRNQQTPYYGTYPLKLTRMAAMEAGVQLTQQRPQAHNPLLS